MFGANLRWKQTGRNSCLYDLSRANVLNELTLTSGGVTLKEAREAATKWRSVRSTGKDPITLRNKEKHETAASNSSLDVLARETFCAKQSSLKGDGKAGRWFSPLELHILPKLGTYNVQEIDQNLICNAIRPIWDKKAVTAQKALNRLNQVLEHAAAKGLDVDLMAVRKAKLLLGAPRHKPKNIPAMPWQDVPDFYASLNTGTVAHLAMRLLILTASRSSPVRYCRLEEINGDVWTVPGSKMKSVKGNEADFRIPLSEAALKTIEAAKGQKRDGFLFPSQRKGVISDAPMSMYMKRKGLEVRPYGFRSSFRDWVAETTEMPRDIAEAALVHSTGSEAERAYRRTDYYEVPLGL